MHEDDNKSLNFYNWFFDRTLFYLRAREFPRWPSRYPWLSPLFKTFFKVKTFFLALHEDPRRAIKFGPKLFRRQVSNEKFIFLIFGPRLFRDGVSICKLFKLNPFLLFGTLRGYVLENDFLPNSGDIDIGLLEEDFKKKDLIKNAMLKKGYKVTKDHDYKLKFSHPAYTYLNLEVYNIFKKDNCMAKGGFGEGEGSLYFHLFPLEIFSKFCEVNFQRCNVLVPLNPEKFLLAHYGYRWKDYKRKMHYSEFQNLTIERLRSIMGIKKIVL